MRKVINRLGGWKWATALTASALLLAAALLWMWSDSNCDHLGYPTGGDQAHCRELAERAQGVG